MGEELRTLRPVVSVIPSLRKRTLACVRAVARL